MSNNVNDISNKSPAQLQQDAQQHQEEMLKLQIQMSTADRDFQVRSGLIEKGDKASEKVGDRIAN